MRKKTEPWKPYETYCKHCGKKGIKTTPIEKYLHEDCKKIRHKIVRLNIKINLKLQTVRYLARVNSHLVKKKRNCLICNKEFMSECNHNRICNHCNNLMEKRIVYIVKIYKNPHI